MHLGPPAHVVARRAAQRRLRRRRRRAIAGVALGLVVAVVVIAMTSSGGRAVSGARGARRAALAPQTRGGAGSSRAGHGALARLDAVGNARIRRLARLGLPVFCGGHHGDAVAFTFDDGPGPYTYLALRKLRQAHQRATFFVVGKSANAYPGYLPRELKVAALADHTYTHPDLVVLPASTVYSELQSAQQLIQRESGQPVDLFRPPYGAIDSTVTQTAKRLGMLPILWTADSRDSLGANYAGITQNVEAALRPGAIILMHENHGQTIRALTAILPYLHRRHLRSVTLPELFATDPPSVAQLRRGSSGCSHGAGFGAGPGAG